MSTLRVKNLSVKIEHKAILENIAVAFPAGRRTAIIGPNGSGKSTLLRVISGLSPSYTGQVMLDGRDLRDFSPRALARQLAVLPQGAAIPADLTAGELIEYGRFPYRSWFRHDAAADRRAVAQAMAQTNTMRLKDRQVATLSGGERQCVWIAMALAQQPKILLLDEPTTYLDIAHQLEVMQIITELNRSGALTVIMVLHDINQARQYADEIVVLKDKQIFSQGAPAEVLTLAMLAEVFGVRADVFTNTEGEVVLAPRSIVK